LLFSATYSSGGLSLFLYPLLPLESCTAYKFALYKLIEIKLAILFTTKITKKRGSCKCIEAAPHHAIYLTLYWTCPCQVWSHSTCPLLTFSAFTDDALHYAVTVIF